MEWSRGRGGRDKARERNLGGSHVYAGRILDDPQKRAVYVIGHGHLQMPGDRGTAAAAGRLGGSELGIHPV